MLGAPPLAAFFFLRPREGCHNTRIVL